MRWCDPRLWRFVADLLSNVHDHAPRTSSTGWGRLGAVFRPRRHLRIYRRDLRHAHYYRHLSGESPAERGDQRGGFVRPADVLRTGRGIAADPVARTAL